MIEVLKKEDGLWVRFFTKHGGKEALVKVGTLATMHGPIVKEAIMEALTEIAKDVPRQETNLERFAMVVENTASAREWIRTGLIAIGVDPDAPVKGEV